MTTEKLTQEIGDNTLFRMAFTNLNNKRIPLTVLNLFTEAYRLLNYIEKHQIKIGER